MVRLSLAGIAAFAATAAAQVAEPSALPDVTAPSGEACGGCYVVADVAGIVFGGVLTATQSVVVGVGSNGSVVTTSIIENQGEATFVSGAPVTGAATSFNPIGSVITVNGATLTSPTSYEVFTAFSVMSTVTAASGCSVSSGTRSSLTSAYSYKVPPNADNAFLLQVESSFIAAVGFPECIAGGGNLQSTVHSQITTATTSITSTGLIRPTPIAASTLPASTAAATSGAASSTASINLATGTGAATSFPSVTISPAINGGSRPGVGAAGALVLAAAGLLGW